MQAQIWVNDFPTAGRASATFKRVVVSQGIGNVTNTGTASATFDRITLFALGTGTGFASATFKRVTAYAIGYYPCELDEGGHYISLSSPSTGTSIVLPTPQFGDTESNQNKIVAKRSMNNQLATYIRRTNIRKLIYTFTIGRPMALNLQAFIDTNIDKNINMENWTGELWKVYITNNPIEFTSRSLFEHEGEQYDVQLQLEGVRIK